MDVDATVLIGHGGGKPFPDGRSAAAAGRLSALEKRFKWSTTRVS
jgi:hypothetical protein